MLRSSDNDQFNSLAVCFEKLDKSRDIDEWTQADQMECEKRHFGDFQRGVVGSP